EDGAAAYLVEVTISPECQLPSIRCFQALQELEMVGKVLATWPSREAIDAGGDEFQIVGLMTSMQSEEQIAAALQAVSDVSSAGVRNIPADQLLAAHEPTAPAPTAVQETENERPRLAVVEDQLAAAEARAS